MVEGTIGLYSSGATSAVKSQNLAKRCFVPLRKILVTESRQLFTTPVLLLLGLGVYWLVDVVVMMAEDKEDDKEEENTSGSPGSVV